jgi:hypothetical protein
MRSHLLVTGLQVLAASLLLTVLTVAAGSSPGGVGLAALLGWSAQATSYVGVGLTVAGALLDELRAPERTRRPADDEPIDYYGG